MSYVLKGEGEGPLPPILLQYCDLKAAFPDHIMLFQIGDFFETFGEDAETVVQHINLTLTFKSSKDFTTAMAGLPIKSIDTHIERLLRAGLCIAIAEQVSSEDNEGLVNRQITQLITPGTVTNEQLLTPDANYLAAVAYDQAYAVTFLDLSTGEFLGTEVETPAELITELLRYQPSEILIDKAISSNKALNLAVDENVLVHESKELPNDSQAVDIIKKQFSSLAAEFGTVALRRAAAMALRYAQGTRQGILPQITKFINYDSSQTLHLDAASLKSLEIFHSNSPLRTTAKTTRIRTLFEALNATRTAAGKRSLKAWLRQPLIDKAAIKQRLDAVELFVENSSLRSTARKLLSTTQDLERLAARLSTGSANPRDIKALERTLSVIPELQKALSLQKAVYAWFEKRRAVIYSLIQLISSLIVEDPPVKTSEGGFILMGADAELDKLQQASAKTQVWLQELELKERKTTGITSLKVISNNNLGYFIEVTRAHFERVPDSYDLVQSLKDRNRYIRGDLRKRYLEIQVVDEQVKLREQELFQELVGQLVKHVDTLKSLSQMLARIDVYASFAEMAVVHNYCRPNFGDHEFIIEQGRHPVVERGGSFMHNGTDLNRDKRLVILTGPNMSGKSTYLRQQALICIMAQAGSFVPAKTANLPIFETIYTRIGASDDLAGGRSTFMVEMQELATILQNANQRSLVLLDEVGRGTSTYDGLSLAWATTEYLHTTSQAYTLFATHYFELTRLANDLSHALNQHVAAEELEDTMVFYHQVLAGPADKSYGIEVARLAGIPSSVVTRAKHVLTQLQSPET